MGRNTDFMKAVKWYCLNDEVFVIATGMALHTLNI